MIKEDPNSRLSMPNLLLVGGNGRNVGKTWFSCRVIEQLAKTNDVSAIKISSHFHPYDPKDVITQTERFIITREQEINGKDSSLMLRAGAQKVYFIMAPQEHLAEAFSMLRPHLPQHAIICESGGLHQVLTPGLFFFINSPGKEITKQHHLNYDPILVTNDGLNIDFDIDNLTFSNNQFSIG